MNKVRVEAGAKAWDKVMGGRYAPDEVSELSFEVMEILSASDKALLESEEKLDMVAECMLSFRHAGEDEEPEWESLTDIEKEVYRTAAQVMMRMVLV